MNIALQSLELDDIQGSGINTDHLCGAGAEHAPAVITAATADIEYPSPGQWFQAREQAIPLPVRAPLGVDVNAKQVKGPLAPGSQLLQGGVQLRSQLGAGIVRATDTDGVTVQVNLGGGDVRQFIQRCQPLWQVGVAPAVEVAVDFSLQAIRPARQWTARPALHQCLEIDHFRATSEAKLKHWNQTSQLLKPALPMRCLWVSSVSGINTFSRALRFWAISRSL